MSKLPATQQTAQQYEGLAIVHDTVDAESVHEGNPSYHGDTQDWPFQCPLSRIRSDAGIHRLLLCTEHDV